MNTKESCTCVHCVNACKNKPGWFMPEQIPAVLAHFGAANLEDLLGSDKLAIDFFDAPQDGPLMLSPNVVGNEGKAFPFEPRGVCVFLKEGLCSIHAVKPFECAEALHSDAQPVFGVRHAEIAQAWRGRKELEEFRKEIPELTIGGVLDMMTTTIQRLKEGAEP